jgi:hypothetical protein
VFAWGGGGKGALGINFDYPRNLNTKGEKWYTKPVRVDEVECVAPSVALHLSHEPIARALAAAA